MDTLALFLFTLCDISVLCPLGQVTGLGAQACLDGQTAWGCPQYQERPHSSMDPGILLLPTFRSSHCLPSRRLTLSPQLRAFRTCPTCLSGLTSYTLFCSIPSRRCWPAPCPKSS